MIRSYLVKLKNSNPFLLYLWSYQQKQKGIKNLQQFTDEEAIVKLYQNFSGKKPNLEEPKTFSEKLQWLKLHYHNNLTTICADKYEVRHFLKVLQFMIQFLN